MGPFTGAVGTINSTDLWGNASPAQRSYNPTSASGPNQGSVTPINASVQLGDGGSPAAAAFAWTGFVIGLVVIGVLVHFGAEVD